MPMSYVLAYVPVVHQGYVTFFEVEQPQGAAGTTVLAILGSALIAQFDQLRKDLRALAPEVVKKQLEATLESQVPVEVATPELLTNWASQESFFTMPDEDIMHELAERYLAKPLAAGHVTFINTFLRWDKQKTLAKSVINPDDTVTQAEFDQRMMAQASAAAERSADWWRQIGGVVVKDGQVIAEAKNHHLPDDYQLAYAGDPRGNFHKGEHVYLSTAAHVESSLVAQAARQGLSLQGADMYVTTFPCPYCAKILAETGLRRLYYRDGYSMVDGQRVMEEAGIEIVRVIGLSQSSVGLG